MTKDKLNISRETQEKIQEIQGLEQNLNYLLMQKQAFQSEFSETENALTEIKNSKEDVFKIIGQIMIKVERKKTEADLTKKSELLNLRLNSIEKQEKELMNELETLRQEIIKEMK